MTLKQRPDFGVSEASVLTRLVLADFDPQVSIRVLADCTDRNPVQGCFAAALSLFELCRLHPAWAPTRSAQAFVRRHVSFLKAICLANLIAASKSAGVGAC
jgi:hypothetical protein